jgi:hypothetical protein
MKTKTMKFVLLSAVLLSPSVSCFAGCVKVDGGSKAPFSGDSLDGYSIDKKAIPVLNKEYPALGITEAVFTGKIQTCSGCSGKYITCE